MSGTTYALLVGIDAYQPPVRPLRGCVRDVETLAELLAARATSQEALRVRTLLDAEATREAVIAAFREHLGQAVEGDTAFFHYSGHGAQAPAPPEMWAVEPDHQLETLVLFDSRQPGKWDLADKELGALVAEVAAKGPHVSVVLDCCHSGTGTRSLDDVVERLAPDDDRQRPIGTFLWGDDGAATTTRGAAWEQPVAPHVLLAACRAGETAKEVSDDGARHGAFSSAMQAALREVGGIVTYRDLHRWASSVVRSRVEEQTPQLETTSATDLDRPFLGGALRPSPADVTLNRDTEKGWAVDAGAVHGIPSPSGQETTELAVFPLGTDSALVGDAVAIARVAEVLPDRSTVTLSTELPTDRTYRARVTAIPLPPLRVRLMGDDPLVAPVRTALESVDAGLAVEVTGEAESDVVVKVTDADTLVFRPGAKAQSAVSTGGAGSAERAVAVVQHIAKWTRLSRLRNPATALPADTVRVELSASSGERSATSLDLAYSVAGALETQPEFTVTLTNTSRRRLWCALVDLTEQYGVFTDAFAAGSIELGPGESVPTKLVGEVADSLVAKGIRSLTDHLKVIVSTTEFDPRTLEQDELDVTSPEAVTRSAERSTAPSLPTSTLERLVQRVNTRRISPKPAATERVSDWTVVDTYVTVSRPAR